MMAPCITSDLVPMPTHYAGWSLNRNLSTAWILCKHDLMETCGSYVQLLWVILLASGFALIIQSLAANLGVVTGNKLRSNWFGACIDISQVCELRPLWFLWIFWDKKAFKARHLVVLVQVLSQCSSAAMGYNLLIKIKIRPSQESICQSTAEQSIRDL